MNEVITFGCRLNFYESEVIKENLKKANRENVIVVHSCAVTNEAERQVKQKIRKIYKNNPKAEIIVAGCAAQLNPEIYIDMPGVVKVLGNADKLKYENYSPDINSTKQTIVSNINHIDKITPNIVSNFTDKSRAFIEIQNGCNHSCTFCVITQARGNNRSLPIENIIEQIKTFLDRGYNEIVFTGVDITDFGMDLFGKPSLGLMIKRVLKALPTLKRLRLSSIDVAEIDEDLLDLIIHEPRLMPHLHLSLQSGNNLILKRMKRRHNREQVILFCNKVKSSRNNIVFGADIIAGFPTETDQMFQDTVELIKEASISYLHVFPYSNKENTPASRMPQLPLSTRKERASYLRRIAHEKLSLFYQSLVNTEQSIIVEQQNIGRSENFALVKFNNPEALVKSIIKLKITDVDGNYLVAQSNQ